MTQYTVSDIKSALEGKIHDASLDKVQGNIFDKLDDAVRNILLSFDIKESKVYSPLTTAIFQNVTTYVAPENMNGDGVITIRKIDGTSSQRFSKTSTEDVTFLKNEYDFSVDYKSGIKVLNLNIPGTDDSTLINDFDSLTANGTFSASGDASDISIDIHNYVSTSASLKVKLAQNGSSGIISVTGMTPVNISSYSDFFGWFSFPYKANFTSPITSIKVRLGNNSSNYIEMTCDKKHDSGSFTPGYNLLRFNVSSSVEVGSPDLSNISYMRYEMLYSSSEDIYVNIDQICAKNGYSYEIGYYSNFLFKDAMTGALKDRPTEDTDIILLGKDSINLVAYEFYELIAQEIQGEDSSFDVKFWQNKNKEIKDAYRLKYPSEAKKKRQTYYKVFKK